MATSETSARVGTGSTIIDSSIWVATITGLPKRRAARVVDGLRDEFADASEDAGGPASQLVSRLLAAGVDLGDREAVAEAIAGIEAAMAPAASSEKATRP